MDYVTLGNSDLSVSRICVGGMSFGRPSADFHEWTLGPEETEQMVVRALGLGINFFDTANVYSHGTSEEYLGAALKKHAKREDVVIATKVYFNEGHLSREAIARARSFGNVRLSVPQYADVRGAERIHSVRFHAEPLQPAVP